MVEQMDGRVDDLGQIVRWDVGGHPHRYALAAIDQQVGEPGRQNLGLGELARVVVNEIDRFLVDAVQENVGDGRQPAFGVALGSRPVVG